uniref:Rhodopsin domain-containing protein n=1 Tax=Pyricularia oryzae (strain 70-15 / ATCC MYA-4617 / FGSC 8958) TaxID=242507 RepID=Q2KEG1_PYRO7|nr:hypothetical protein MGCH7_ch7g1075 [Pyricularia oryzae 70-15]
MVQAAQVIALFRLCCLEICTGYITTALLKDKDFSQDSAFASTTCRKGGLGKRIPWAKRGSKHLKVPSVSLQVGETTCTRLAQRSQSQERKKTESMSAPVAAGDNSVCTLEDAMRSSGTRTPAQDSHQPVLHPRVPPLGGSKLGSRNIAPLRAPDCTESSEYNIACVKPKEVIEWSSHCITARGRTKRRILAVCHAVWPPKLWFVVTTSWDKDLQEQSVARKSHEDNRESYANHDKAIFFPGDPGQWCQGFSEDVMGLETRRSLGCGPWNIPMELGIGTASEDGKPTGTLQMFWNHATVRWEAENRWAEKGMYLDASDLGPSLRATTSVLVPIVTIFITMRIWIRYSKHQLAWEDALITFSWIVFTVMCAAGVTATAYGFGKRSVLVTASELPMMRLYSGMVASVAWSLSITSAKASFAVMFLRILQPTGGSWVRPLNISILVFLACQATEEILVVLLQCKPFAKAFDDTIDGNCYSLETMWLCDFAFNFAVDLVLFIQPIPTIWSLQIASTASKIGITTMLSMGLMQLSVSSPSRASLRSYVYEKTQPTKKPEFATYPDNAKTTDETALAVILCQLEIACIIICSCVPALNQFIRGMGCLGRIVNSTANNNSYSLPQFYARSGQWRRRRSDTVNDVVYRDSAESRGMEAADEEQHRRRRPRRPTRTMSSAPTGGGGTTLVTLTPESAMEELGLELNPLRDDHLAEETARRFVTREGVEMWHQPGSIERRASHSSTTSQEAANQAVAGGLGGAASEDSDPTLATVGGLTVNIPTWLDHVSDGEMEICLHKTNPEKFRDEGVAASNAGEKRGLDSPDSADQREHVDDDDKGNEADDDWVSAAEHRSDSGSRDSGSEGRQTPSPGLGAGVLGTNMTSHEKGG